MAFLADDLLEGRETGSRGHEIAARYVAAQFAQYGVKPRGHGGGYLQTLPLQTGRQVSGSAVFEIHRAGAVQALTHLDDFTVSTTLSSDESDVSAPLVFVGHGITAPAFGHDDYAGIDVKGKIAVMLSDRPTAWPTEEGAHYAGGLTKARLAAQHGAVGIVTLQTPRAEQRSPFAQARLYAGSQVMDWITPEGRGARETPGLRGTARLSLAASAGLFSEVALKLDAVFAAVQAGQPVPRMPLGLSARIAQKTQRLAGSSANVVGLVEGSDPLLKQEFVVFGAHLDHLGLRPTMSGDGIMNGALDNASGVATLLEVARLFAQQPVKPKRSLLFIAFTGEEKGLLGSDHFARQPTVPAQALVACVNLDMPILLYDFSSVVAFGAERSTLKAAAAKAAAALQLSLVPDPSPEEGRFTRTDHYSFVRQGVPSVFVVPGPSSFKPQEDPEALSTVFRRQHYHRPSDDMTLPLQWDAAVRFAQLNYLLGLEVANAPGRVRWNDGDFFGDLFRPPAPR